jgi:hypothetical protein
MRRSGWLTNLGRANGLNDVVDDLLSFFWLQIVNHVVEVGRGEVLDAVYDRL